MSTKIEIRFYLSMLPRYLFLKIFFFLFDVENVSMEIVILYLKQMRYLTILTFMGQSYFSGKYYDREIEKA